MDAKELYEAVMRCAINKCILYGEYYDETEDGNVGFEMSEDAKIYLNHVSVLAKDLAGWLDKKTDIEHLIEELSEDEQ